MPIPYHPDLKQPFITLELRFGGRKIKTEALVDSGATVSIFKRELASFLGLPIKEAKEDESGAAGGTEFKVLYFPGYALEGQFKKRKFPLGAVFYKKSDPNAINLLGRNDFFRAFKVIFDQRANKFDLIPYDE
ncbi:MAG: hypothetical protein Q8M92_06765 [Candidatus Subteraquimicrobiales bacterium]|nr:hypothetical protein [Candidatus Subteraquimicrobiales bacterium]